jgi:hypothetical protein
MNRALSRSNAHRPHSRASPTPSRCPPPLQGSWTFVRRQAEQKPFDRDVLVEIGPVNSVEFFDMTGNTVAVVTLRANALRLPTPTDRSALSA